MKPVKAWAGYCDGVINVEKPFLQGSPTVAVFATREQARVGYSDVRRIEIREVKARKAVARDDG
jgi:hypothetical protein